MKRPASLARGFTLVEVLVALTIMAVLAAMAWQGIDAMLRSRTINQESVERTLRLSAVLGQWEHDLMALHTAPRVVAGGPNPSPNTPTAGPPSFAFDGKSVRLTRRTETGLQIVVWALRDGALTRWAGPATINATQLIEQWMQSQQLLGNESNQLRALTGLSSFQVYCYRTQSNNWSNCQSTGSVNVGIRLVLGFAAGTEETTLTRDIALGPP